MDTLVSLKSTYREFKYDQEIKLASVKGELKNSLRYGEAYELPVQQKFILFYLGNSKLIGETMIRVLEYYAQIKEKKQIFIHIIAGKRVQQDQIPVPLQENIIRPGSKEAVKDFAMAEYILTKGILPKYFVRKPDQKVVQIFDQIDTTFDKKRNSENKISWILNSSHIFVKPEDKAMFLDRYYIPDEYNSRIYEMKEVNPAEDIIKKMCHTNKTEEKESGQKKKNILIIASSWKIGGHEECYIKLMAENIDYEKYDLTLVMKRPFGGNREEAVQSFHDKMRIIYRKGTFSCSQKDYIKTQYLLKNFDSFEEIEKAYPMLDRKIIEREKRRILGDMAFSQVIYIGRHSAVWSMLAENIKADCKLRILNHDLNDELLSYKTEEKQLGFYNKMKLYDHIFDQIVFTKSQYMKSTIREQYVKKAKATSFEFANQITKNSDEHKAQCVEYQGRRYFVGQRYEYSHGGERIVLFPLPESEEKAYLANADLCNKKILLKIFEMLYKQDENSLLIIYGRDAKMIRQAAKEYKLDERIKILERKSLEMNHDPRRYFKYFEGCIITDEEDKNGMISIVMSLLGKKLITFEGDKITDLKINRFKDVTDYNEYIKERWNQFYDTRRG